MLRANERSVARYAVWLPWVVVFGCGAPLAPTGPAPEYETPVYPAWDAGQPSREKDPFELDPAQMAPPLPPSDAGPDGAPSDAAPASVPSDARPELDRSRRKPSDGAALDGQAALRASRTSVGDQGKLRTADFAEKDAEKDEEPR